MDRSHLVCGAGGAAAALLLAGLVAAQTGRATPAVPAVPADFLTEPTPTFTTPPPRPAARPGEKTIDELVASLEQIKARRAELDRVEKETVAMLREKLRQQRQRLHKLGVADEVPQPPPTCAAPVQPSLSSQAEPVAPQAAPPAYSVPPMPQADGPPTASVN
ncbi:MAG: hypothetical protein U0797_17905 [Gemmataceae bacterium]